MENIYIKTYGCAQNQSDSEVMAGLLKSSGFNITNSYRNADIIIINTCTVKGPSESKLFNFLDKIKGKIAKEKILISGCIAQTDPEKLKGFSLIGIDQIKNIVEIVEEVLNKNTVISIAREEKNILNLPKIRKNKLISIIPICEGCLGAPCAYCKVKASRGSLRSYTKEDIIKELRSAKSSGCRQIWLTAQDTGCYGKDIRSNLPNLLEELISIPGDFKIRLGMLNPDFALEYLDDLIKIFSSDKMYKFIHIPVQSGNDNILESMKRRYSSQDFLNVASQLRKSHPDLSIATDIIVGFPGETFDQFKDSLEIIKKVMPDKVHVSRFWRREKTAAYDMENQVKGDEIKKRSRLMSDTVNNVSLLRNERWIGWQGNVLIEKKGKDNSYVARNFAYKPIILKGNYEIGQTLNVKINRVTPHDLRA